MFSLSVSDKTVGQMDLCIRRESKVSHYSKLNPSALWQFQSSLTIPSISLSSSVWLA